MFPYYIVFFPPFLISVQSWKFTSTVNDVVVKHYFQPQFSGKALKPYFLVIPIAMGSVTFSSWPCMVSFFGGFFPPFRQPKTNRFLQPHKLDGWRNPSPRWDIIFIIFWQRNLVIGCRRWSMECFRHDYCWVVKSAHWSKFYQALMNRPHFYQCMASFRETANILCALRWM